MSVAIPLPTLPPNSAFTSPEYLKALDQLVSTRDAGKPTSWKATDQWAMSSAHTIFLNLLLRVYALADHAVETCDLANYLGFASVAFGQLHFHHHFEEFFFPYMEKNIDNYASDPRLTQNVTEHRIFDKQLNDAWVYVQTCRDQLLPTPKPALIRPPPEIIAASATSSTFIDPTGGFSPAKLRAHMDTWVIPLAKHLAAEIPTLDPEWVGQMGKEKHDALDKSVEAHLKEHNPAWFLTSSLGSLPNHVSKALIPLPMPVRRVLVPFVFARAHKGYWKYLEYPEHLTWGGST